MGKYFMGIDNGGTVCKVAIYNSCGQEIALASRKIDMIYPKPGHTEKDMNEFWLANLEAITEVVRSSGINPSDIAGVAATGHGNGMFLIDEKGKSVGNGIISTDNRAKRWVDRWYSDGTFEKINKKTLQSIWSAQPVALLNWFKENKPEEIKKIKWILMCKDYIRFKLTDEIWAEITDYSGTNLLNVVKTDYDNELLKLFNLEEFRDKLPPLRKSTDICGYITSKIAAETGLIEGTPVIAGLFDIDACAIATGLTNEHDISIIAGTWSINQFISKKPVASKKLFMTSIYGIPGYWLVSEASATSASNLEWFLKNFMKDSSYLELNQMVESIKPEDSEIIFLPFLYDCSIGNLSSCFVGLQGWHTKEHLLRAIYEGIVFGHKIHVDKLLGQRGPVRHIKISGGASKSEVWVQMFADILQIPIEITGAEEIGTLGAAICAAVGVGEFSSFKEATESMVHVSKIIKPNPDSAKIYNRKYALFCKYIGAIKNIF